MKTLTQVGNIPESALKAVARRKRYDTSNLNMVLAIAGRDSIKFNIDYYVFCTTNGYELTPKREKIPGNPNMYIVKGSKIFLT